MNEWMNEWMNEERDEMIHGWKLIIAWIKKSRMNERMIAFFQPPILDPLTLWARNSWLVSNSRGENKQISKNVKVCKMSQQPFLAFPSFNHHSTNRDRKNLWGGGHQKQNSITDNLEYSVKKTVFIFENLVFWIWSQMCNTAYPCLNPTPKK